jgi:hypothetical protein
VRAASGAEVAPEAITGLSDAQLKILSLELQVCDLAAQLSRMCDVLESRLPAMVTDDSKSAEPRGFVPRALFNEEEEESSRRELNEEPSPSQYGQEEDVEQDWLSDGEETKKRTTERETTNLSPARKASRSVGTLEGFFKRGTLGTGRESAEARGRK